jgi:GH35 family endo-1,4-beta-xylanase
MNHVHVYAETKWFKLNPALGIWDFRKADKLVAWALSNNLQVLNLRLHRRLRNCRSG